MVKQKNIVSSGVIVNSDAATAIVQKGTQFDVSSSFEDYVATAFIPASVVTVVAIALQTMGDATALPAAMPLSIGMFAVIAAIGTAAVKLFAFLDAYEYFSSGDKDVSHKGKLKTVAWVFAKKSLRTRSHVVFHPSDKNVRQRDVVTYKGKVYVYDDLIIPTEQVAIESQKTANKALEQWYAALSTCKQAYNYNELRVAYYEQIVNSIQDQWFQLNQTYSLASKAYQKDPSDVTLHHRDDIVIALDDVELKLTSITEKLNIARSMVGR